MANVGGAFANTGGNRHGGVAGQPVALDDRTQLIVAELAGYLGDLVAEINGWNPGSACASTSLALPLGDLLVGIESTLTGSLVELESAGVVSGTAGARVRQVTAIINLGIARANTGANTTVSIVVGPDAAAVAADLRTTAATSTTSTATLVTGDAVARNASLVIICQLDDSADHPCLRPPSEEPENPGTASPETGSTRAAGRGSRPFVVAVPVHDRPPDPVTSPRLSTSRHAAGSCRPPVRDIQVMLVLGAAMVIVGGALTRCPPASRGVIRRRCAVATATAVTAIVVLTAEL